MFSDEEQKVRTEASIMLDQILRELPCEYCIPSASSLKESL